MAHFASHYNLFKIINGLRVVLSIIFWTVLAISIIPIALRYFHFSLNIDDLLNVLNIIFLLIYFSVDIVIEYILTPQADSKRRDDFLDNSLGTNFSLQSSVGYFDNDEVQEGIYKVAVNLFQNCFFTYSLVKKITLEKIMLPLVVLIVIAVFAYIGFKDSPIALSILQALFSATLLGGLVKHFILMVRLNSIETALINLFQNGQFKIQPQDYQHLIYKSWLNYESLHSKIPAEVPAKVYNRYNRRLTQDWVNLKIRYQIS